jgi:branched-subunit amino acid aminotransferase/4-amino-4-deoxychorismate lyase
MSRVCRNGVLAAGDASPGSFPAGAAFFETLALRAGAVECLDDHLARLRGGLDRAGLAAGPLAAGDPTAWRAALRLLEGREGVLRLVVGPGFEELGLRALLPSPDVFRLRSLRTVRDAPEWLPRPKSAPWANSLAASVELRSLGAGAGVEGVQFDARGCVSEASRSSLAWVEDGELRVPAASTGRLPGTALGQLVRCAGLPVREVEEGVPLRADALLVLRSTLPGGGAAAARWDDAAGRPLWSGDPAAARPLLAALAAWRAQRCVSLL